MKTTIRKYGFFVKRLFDRDPKYKFRINKIIIYKITNLYFNTNFFTIPLAIINFILMQRVFAKLFNIKYKPCNIISFEITTACDLKCLNCHKLCGVAPGDDYISLEQVQRFIQDSIQKNNPWKTIYVNGGEPLLNKELISILKLLLSYKEKECPSLRLVCYTSEYTKNLDLRNQLSQIPKGIVITNSKKKSRIHRFAPICKAPIDNDLFKFADYSKGCNVLKLSGVCFTPFGYYPCQHAAAIDRVIGYNLGRKHIFSLDEDFSQDFEKLCKYCGIFSKHWRTKEEKISKSWKNILENYKNDPPKLTYF